MTPTPHNKNGFALVSVLITATTTSFIMLAFMKMHDSHNKFERGIASNYDLTEISSTVRAILGASGGCQNSGLIGTDLSPLLVPSPQPVAVALHLPALSGVGPVYLAQNINVTNTRRVRSLSVTSLGALGAGNYLATLHLETEIIGTAATVRNPEKDFFLRVGLNAANEIASCGEQPVMPSQAGIYVKDLFDNSCAIKNPLTGSCNCPQGYTGRVFHNFVRICNVLNGIEIQVATCSFYDNFAGVSHGTVHGATYGIEEFQCVLTAAIVP